MPIGAISASPGSIYPCLQRLEASELISGIKTGGEVKARYRYELTSKGRRELNKWSKKPIDAKMALTSPETLFVRLSFLTMNAEELHEQLGLLRRDLQEESANLDAYMEDSASFQNDGGKLAMSLALTLLDSLVQWTLSSQKILSNS